MDPDLYYEYGSRKLMNTDPIRIRIHNTGNKKHKSALKLKWDLDEPVIGTRKLKGGLRGGVV